MHARRPTERFCQNIRHTVTRNRNSEMTPDDLQRLVTTAMPFGKHKGTLLADLPGNYLNWFAREGFPDGDIGRLLALMHEIDHNGLGELLTPLRGTCR